MRGEVKCQPGAVIGRVIMSSWEDKVVIITGGAAGIGRATAMLLADVGARVLVTGRRSEPLKRVTENRDNMDFILADATKPEDAYRTIATVIESSSVGDALTCW
jgi:NADP-dependent 3-hydroxy acid dehydrogenase YdfG